jgi:hypothetical protein
MLSLPGPDGFVEVYYLGVIDLLTAYSARKTVERGFKALAQDRRGISAQRPQEYARRFVEFLRNETVSVPLPPFQPDDVPTFGFAPAAEDESLSSGFTSGSESNSDTDTNSDTGTDTDTDTGTGPEDVVVGVEEPTSEPSSSQP